jgi:hypothetical protein
MAAAHARPGRDNPTQHASGYQNNDCGKNRRRIPNADHFLFHGLLNLPP